MEGSLGALTNEKWIKSWLGRKLVTPEDCTNSFATEERYLEQLRRAFYELRNANVGWGDGQSTSDQ